MRENVTVQLWTSIYSPGGTVDIAMAFVLRSAIVGDGAGVAAAGTAGAGVLIGF